MWKHWYSRPTGTEEWVEVGGSEVPAEVRDELTERCEEYGEAEDEWSDGEMDYRLVLTNAA